MKMKGSKRRIGKEEELRQRERGREEEKGGREGGGLEVKDEEYEHKDEKGKKRKTKIGKPIATKWDKEII